MLKQTIPKKTKLKTYNKGVCPMRKFLFILPVLMIAFLVLPLTKAYADAFTVDSLTTSILPFDTVYCGATKVPIFGFTIKPSGPDTLQRVTITSFNERAFAVEKVYLYRENGAAGFQGTEQLLKSVDITGRFETNDTVQLSAQNMYVFTDTSTKVFYVVVDINNDTVCAYPGDFHQTGLDAIIDTNDISLKDGTEGPPARVHSYDFDPGPPPSGTYRVYFDTQPPAFSLHWDWLDEGSAGDNCKIDTIDLLDTLVIWANNNPEGDTSEIDSVIILNLSFLGNGTAYSNFKLRQGSNYTDTLVIPDSVITACIDVIAGYTVQGSAKDMAGNTGYADLVFDKPIDTCKPKIDSLKFFISYDANGDGIAALGDSLTIWAYCTSNPAWEVDSVVADISNFFNSTTTLNLDDVTNNNWIFRGKFELDEAKALDIPADSLLNRIWVTAWDNACNTKLDSIDLDMPVDLEPPFIDGGNFLALMDFDSTGCINIGDSVLIRVTTDATADVESVMAWVLSAGIGVTPSVALVDSGANVWRLRWGVLEPPPDSAKDADAWPNDADYSVWCYVYDDAGNYDSTYLGFDKTLDTRRPTAILKDSIAVEVLPSGRIRLIWTLASPPQAQDPMYFWIYVDSTGGGFNFNTPFGATFNGEYSPTQNAWTSEILTHGKIYRFVIRTEDNCGNWEFNTNIIEAIPDSDPPLICIIEPDTGLSFGVCDNCLEVKALTEDMDAASARIWYRIKDVGGGVPGPWIPWGSDMDTLAGDTTYPGHRVFIDYLCDFPGTDTYELIVIGTDLVGNETPFDTALLACSPRFFFHWYDEDVVANIISINGAYNPQTACGYDVTREALNQCVVTINDTAYNEPVYTVEAWAILNPGDDETRILYVENQTMPYTFNFNVGDWPKGPQKLFVQITDTRSECYGRDSVMVCVPDTLAPQSSIVWPTMGMRVHKASSSLNWVDIWATVNFNALDPEVVANVHFEYSLNQTDWFLIEKVLGTDFIVAGWYTLDTFWVAQWDNSNLANGDTVYLRAIFYDELHNQYITPLVMVIVDANVPDIVLNIPQTKVVNGVPKVAGYIDLIAQLNDTVTVNDIAEVRFYIKRSDKPDIFWYYQDIGSGTQLTNSSIWKLGNVNTGGWDDQYWWDIRAIAWDIAGNVMWDSDGDQLFDDYTFNQLNPSDKKVFVDNQAPWPAIFSVKSMGLNDTLETVNPSYWLGGSGIAFVQAGKLVQVRTTALRYPPYDLMVDTAEVRRIEYTISGTGPEQNIGYRENYPYTITFDPRDFGYLALNGGYTDVYLTAYLYDMLDNPPNSDGIYLYILDVTGNQVVITTPKNNSYNRRDINLTAAALNAAWDDIKAVTYWYGVISSFPGKGGAQVETTWYEIATVPTWVRQIDGLGKSVVIPTWPAVWKTFNNDLNHDGDFTDDDGWYLMRAISEDSAGNTAIGPMLKVNVTNHDPIARMSAPPDSSVVGPNMNVRGQTDVSVQAIAKKYSANSAGIDYVRFGVKSQTASSFIWFPFLNPDSLTMHLDSLYTRMWAIVCGSSEWLHVSAEAYDSAGNVGYADTLNIFKDCDEPNGEIVAINGDHNTYMKDITPLDTALIVARAWDMPAEYQAGLDTIQFYIESWHHGYSYLGTPLGPDANGQYWLTWNHAGLPADTYDVQMYLVDKVNNSYWSAKAPMVIRDITVPVGVVRAFHPYYVFASTENPVDYLQIQYQQMGGAEWINLGLATTYGSYDDLWWTPWDPMSLAGTADMHYLFRAVPLRGYIDKQGVQKFALLDNFIAPPVHVTIDPDGNVTTEGTDAIGPRSFKANLASDSKGTCTFTNTTEKPYLLVIYSDLTGDVMNAMVTDVLKESGDTDRWNAVFDVQDIWAIGGRADFCASIYTTDPTSAGYIEHSGFDITKVTVDLGTNGWITSMDEDAKINIPSGAVPDTLNLVIYPTEKPPVTSNLCKKYIPIGNDDELLEKFYLYNSDYHDNGGPGSGGISELESGFYSTITLFYNPAEVTGGDESKLLVGRWNFSTLCWEFGGIMDPVVDTENNSITFKTNQMGLYAVLEMGSPLRASIVVEPNCAGYTYKFPLFMATIYDENLGVGGVDESTIVVRYRLLGATYWQYAYQYETPTAGFEFADGYPEYDPYSGILKVVKIYQPLAAGTYEVEVRALNINGILATAQTTFTVETSKPLVNVPHGYVYKNPVFTFVVKDTGSGVDKNSIFVDLYSATMTDSTTTWYRKYIETITPTSMEWLNDTTVKVTSTYHLRTGQYLDVVVYDGGWGYYDYYYDEYRYYDNEDGVLDCVGNQAFVVERRFTIDWAAPLITMLSTKWVNPLLFKIRDAESGVSLEDIVVKQNGSVAPAESITYDPATGILTYRPPTFGAVIEIVATDSVGNSTYYQPFFDDKTAPNIAIISDASLSERPIKIKITDSGAGVNWNTLDLTFTGYTGEGTPLDSTVIDEGTGIAKIFVKDGMFKGELTVQDYIGNKADWEFEVQATVLSMTNPHNFPNPFDPRTKQPTEIVTDLSQSTDIDVTVKIYDFAGDYVATLTPVNNKYFWYGTTDKGEMVANGIYFCHIKAKNGSQTASAVIKIAVVKKD